MSFEAYIQCYEDGKPAGVSRQKVRDAFGEYLTEVSPTDWHLSYNQLNACDCLLTPNESDNSLINSLIVLRPSADERLWDALFSILTLGNVVIYFPANCPPLIANIKVAQHLPLGMIEALGQPKCVTSGKEILKELESS